MEIIKRLTEFLKRCGIPILLLTVLFGSVIYIYACGDNGIFIGLTAVSLVYFTLLAALLDFLQRLGKTWLTTIIVFVLQAVSIIIGDSLLETRHVDTMQWFFEPSKFPEVYTGNILAVLVLVGFVLGDSLYYFTRVRFRPVFVFLICMCPFSLFAKSFTEIPVLFTILIITLFFLLIITNQAKNTSFRGKNRYAAITVFIAVITAGAALMPKLEYAPYREQFDELITGVNVSVASQIDFNNFSDSSSFTSSSGDEEEVLYTISGTNPVYIKRQCFNSYNKQTDLWEYYGDVGTGYNNYSHYIKWENPAALAAEYGITMDIPKNFSIISSEKEPVMAVYTPENIASIEFMYSSEANYGLRHVYRTALDEYFHTGGNSWDSYSVSWYDFDVDVEFMLFYNDETAEKIDGQNARAYLESKREMQEYHDPLMTEEARRSCYDSDEDFIRVKELTEQITANCTNAYTKAQAIEQYFKSKDFFYDKEFRPADGSINYFLFNTKRGICTDYATAMVLMCREAGLYARYVEGFLVQKVDAEGNFYVTAADGHAYVQVWLDGYGWTDFDPTSSNIYESKDNTFVIVGIATILLALAAILIIFVLPVIKEKRFVASMGKIRGREQLVKLYPRISEMIHRELHMKQNIMTVNELKTAVLDNYCVDISMLAEDYEKTVYGNIDCGKNNYISVYIELKKAIKNKNAEKRKKK